jgi:hypothetical protein
LKRPNKKATSASYGVLKGLEQPPLRAGVALTEGILRGWRARVKRLFKKEKELTLRR